MNFLYEEIEVNSSNDYIQFDISFVSSLNKIVHTESLYLHNVNLLEEVIEKLEKFKDYDELEHLEIDSFKIKKPVDQVRSGFTLFYCSFIIENIYLHSKNKTFRITYYD